jgi:Rrf2 family transcriptional regulator, iron-sulfur cluster assembly transcription factor
MLSSTSKYALRAVIYLAVKGDGDSKIGIRQISQDLKIPMPFLGKIMQVLAKQKLLSSTKGPHGGFSLAKSAYDISLMDIVEVIDGIDNFNMCVLGLDACSHETSHCPIHQDYAEIREKLKTLFQSENIGLMADRIKESNFALVL